VEGLSLAGYRSALSVRVSSVEFSFEFTRPVDKPVPASVLSTSLMSGQRVHYLSGNFI
jgi:hypothetical protein